jgi:hypothetical protein
MARWSGSLARATIFARLPPERDYAAEIPPLALVGLHIADALTNSIAFRFGHGREAGPMTLFTATALPPPRPWSSLSTLPRVAWK